ncbi:hypothetical protein AMTRI_Chr01g136640 [Amborella trichopoda]
MQRTERERDREWRARKSLERYGRWWKRWIWLMATVTTWSHLTTPSLSSNVFVRPTMKRPLMTSLTPSASRSSLSVSLSKLNHLNHVPNELKRIWTKTWD